MSTASADRLRTRAAVLAALVVAAHAGVVLIGWAAGWPLFLVPSPSFIPMAPTTALAFLALSLALVARALHRCAGHDRRDRRRHGRAGIRVRDAAPLRRWYDSRRTPDRFEPPHPRRRRGPHGWPRRVADGPAGRRRAAGADAAGVSPGDRRTDRPHRLARCTAGRAVRRGPCLDRRLVRRDRCGARLPARRAAVAPHRVEDRSGQRGATSRRTPLS